MSCCILLGVTGFPLGRGRQGEQEMWLLLGRRLRKLLCHRQTDTDNRFGFIIKEIDLFFVKGTLPQNILIIKSGHIGQMNSLNMGVLNKIS